MLYYQTESDLLEAHLEKIDQYFGRLDEKCNVKERPLKTAEGSAGVQTEQYDEFWTQDDFSGWSLNGVQVDISPQASARLCPQPGMTCSAVDIDGGALQYDTTARLCQGRDPYKAGKYNNENYYNGNTFFFGTMTSPVITPQKPITSVVASWNAETRPGTWLQLHIRALKQDSWTRWYNLPVWAADFSTVKRHSVDGQDDGNGKVATDTFLTGSIPASAYQLSVTLFTTDPALSPIIRRITAIASFDAEKSPTIEPDRAVWGKELNVPMRSQVLPEYRGLGFGGGGEVWCSPTSTSMVMAYWADKTARPELVQSVPEAAKGCYDFTYDGTGNWPFNTAYAGAHGLRAFVTRLYSLSQVEQWIKAGVPLVASVAYKHGELPGTPIESSDGHLLVIRGFTESGDVITNDPAGPTNDAVRIIYNRIAFERVWQKYSHGIVYVITPEGFPLPTEKRLTNW